SGNDGLIIVKLSAFQALNKKMQKYSYIISFVSLLQMSKALMMETSETVDWERTGRFEIGALRAGVSRVVGDGRIELMGKGKGMGAATAGGATTAAAAVGTAARVTGATETETRGAAAGNRVVTLNPAGVTAGIMGVRGIGAGAMTGDGTSGTRGATGVRVAVGTVTGKTATEPPEEPPGVDAFDRPAGTEGATAACFGGRRYLFTSASNPNSSIPGSTRDWGIADKKGRNVGGKG
ncbi:MAG: hypothetical protein AB1847_10335, partial [bacterium]